MEQKIKLNYINTKLKIGMGNWREVYILYPQPRALTPEVSKGTLVYRAKGSTKRYSYLQIKKGLLKKELWIVEQVPSWLL